MKVYWEGTEQCSGPGSWAVGSWPPGSIITIFVQIRILPAKLKTLLSTVCDFLIICFPDNLLSLKTDVNVPTILNKRKTNFCRAS